MAEDANAREWLERRFSRGDAGSYFAHQPIYGFASPHSEPGHLRRLARTLHMLRVASRIGAETMLDVGGGEGYFAHLCRELLGIRAAIVELPISACERAGELFGIPAVSADAAELPFADNSFDLVVCSEVMEHVVAPHQVAAELTRVARKFVLVTTEQFCATHAEQSLQLALRDPSDPHPDRNYFTLGDLRKLFGGAIYQASEYWDFLPWDEHAMSRAFARRLVFAHSRIRALNRRGVGVVYLVRKSGELHAPSLDERNALDVIMNPLIASPDANPARHPPAWPHGLHRPMLWHDRWMRFVCQPGDLHIVNEDGSTTPLGDPEDAEKPASLSWPRPALAFYNPPLREAPPPPEWARKFDLGNVTQGAAREKLSRNLRRRKFSRILAAPEPVLPKLAWLAGRALRRLLRTRKA